MIEIVNDITGRIISVNLINDAVKTKIRKVNREQFLNLVKSGKIEGAKLTENGTLLVNYVRYTKIKHTTIMNKVLTKRDINITKVYYYKLSGEKIVDSIEILANNQKIIKELIQLGGYRVSESHIRLNKLALWRLCHTYSRETYELGFLSNIVTYDVRYIYVTYSKNINRGVEFIKLESDIKDRLNAWINKAKMLGIYDNYTIDIQGSRLEQYRGKDKNPSLPPVRFISDRCFSEDTVIEELNLPDTLTQIDYNTFTHLKRLNLNEQLIDVSTLTLQDKIIDEINLLNVVSYAHIHWFRYARTTLNCTITTKLGEFTKNYIDANNINPANTYIEIFNI